MGLSSLFLTQSSSFCKGQGDFREKSLFVSGLYVGGPLASAQDFDESGSNTPYREVDYTYGPEGETSTVNGSTEPVVYTHDGLYRLSTLSDGNLNATHYYYHASGYLAGVTYPGYAGPVPNAVNDYTNISGKDSVSFPSYDYDGNVLYRTDGNGTTTTYTYNDPESQLTNISYSPGTGVSALAPTAIAYDQYGRRAIVTDSATGKTDTYDDDDNLLTEVKTFVGTSLAPTTTYTYNADGSCHTMSVNAVKSTYAYDGAGRMQTLTNVYGEVSSWAYDPNNWLASQTLGNGVTTTYAYNPRGFMAGLKTTAPAAQGGAIIAQFGGTAGTSAAMTYDGVGNRIQTNATLSPVPGYQTTAPNGPVNLNGLTTYAYTDDTRNELTKEQSTVPGNAPGANTYTYDTAENRASYNGTNTPHNKDNQLSTAPYYASDGNGNPTTYTSPANPTAGFSTALTFDPENRLETRVVTAKN